MMADGVIHNINQATADEKPKATQFYQGLLG
jgi:hypothetical protein